MSSVDISVLSMKSTKISGIDYTNNSQSDDKLQNSIDVSVNNVKKENSMVRFDMDLMNKKPEVSHRYLPQIHRQKTEILPTSLVQKHLVDLNELLPDYRSERGAAELEASRIINKFLPNLKSVSGLDFKAHFYLHNEVQFHQEPKVLYCILPFKDDSAYVKHLDPGYVTFRLPKVDALRADSFKNVRSSEGAQLSPLKFQTHFEQLFAKTIEKLVKSNRKVRFEDRNSSENRKISTQRNDEKALLENVTGSELNNADPSLDSTTERVSYQEIKEHPKCDMANLNENNEKVETNNSELNNSHVIEASTVDKDNLFLSLSEEIPSPRIKWSKIVDKDKSLTFKLGFDWSLELVPAIFTSSKEPVYVMKPYEADENPTSDLRWRICYAKRESKILKSIRNTDKDLRFRAIKLVSAILNCDTRLQLLKEYEIQTCLLYEMDNCMDETPRWQRQTLETCVKSLIRRILHLISHKNLSHFFIPEFNLLEQWTSSEYELAKSALERIVSSDTVLISLIQKSIGILSSSEIPSPSSSVTSSCCPTPKSG